MCRTAALGAGVIFLFASRACYNLTVLILSQTHHVESFNFDWYNVSDQVNIKCSDTTNMLLDNPVCVCVCFFWYLIKDHFWYKPLDLIGTKTLVLGWQNLVSDSPGDLLAKICIQAMLDRVRSQLGRRWLGLGVRG